MTLLSGKIVVVTGGAGLLGRAFAEGIVAAGGTAIVADVALDAAERVAAGLNATAGAGRGVAAYIDITDANSIASLVETISGSHGRIDALVNNAYPRNKNYGRPLEAVTYQDFSENLSVHVGGYFLASQQFALYFKKHGGGRIINMGSIYGTMAPRFQLYADTSFTMPVEYAAIKAAIVHLTRYFAQYYKHDGIRANCLSPGGILDRQPTSFVEAYGAHCGAQGMLLPPQVVATLVFLLSDGAAHITGQNLIVDDGFSL